MSLISRIQVSPHSHAAILDLKHFATALNDKSKRNTEKEGFRHLLNLLVPGGAELLEYMPSGKPFLKGDIRHISLSHSHERLAVIVNEKEATGIDIELIRNKVLDVRHKFLHPDELAVLDATHVEKNLVYWAAKESLYKIQGTREINFPEHLYVHDFSYTPDGGIISGEIRAKGEINCYDMTYTKTEDYILVYMLKACHKELKIV